VGKRTTEEMRLEAITENSQWRRRHGVMR